MSMHDPSATLGVPRQRLASLLTRPYPTGKTKTILRAEYLLLRNSMLWPQKIAAAKQRVQLVQKVLAELTSTLADVSNLAISVPQDKTQGNFSTHATGNPTQVTKINEGLDRLHQSYVSMVHPGSDAPGAVPSTVTGKRKLPSGQLEDVPGITVTTYVYRPALMSTVPDFSSVEHARKPFQRRYVEALPSPGAVAASAASETLYVASYAIPKLDPSVHSGADIAKVIKILQAEIDNLNKIFNTEFGDSSNLMSLQNTSNQMIKEFFERRMQVLLRCFGA